MAKIRIKGDTSGYIDIAAPAEAGTQTLTLPTSGSLLSSEDVLDSDQIGTGAVSANKIASGAIESAMTTQFGRRNIIINGGMTVSQRGDYTSPTSASDSSLYLDRHKTWLNVVTGTIQHTTVSINGVSKRAYKIVATSSGTGYIGFYQYIELQNIPVGETVTVSAWVRSNNSLTRFRSSLSGTGTDGTTTHAGDGNWEKMTYSVDTTGLSSSPYVGIITYDGTNVPVSSGDYIEFTDFQVEVGTVATPFEHRSYGEELALCQRYYEKFGQGWWARFESGSQLVVNGQFKVEKRTAPSIGLPVGGTIRLYEWGVGDRDVSPSLTGTAMAVNGGHFKLSGFSSGSTGEIWGVGGTPSNFATQPFEANSEF